MKTVLVTGATGHLGLNLVSELLTRGFRVRAVVRDKEKAVMLGLDETTAEIVVADLTNFVSTSEVMHDIDIVFQAAANFSHWSKKPEVEIIATNNLISSNVLQAAKEMGVKKVIYVSSVGALKRNASGIVRPDEWIENTYGNPYFESKLQSERLAWKRANEFDLEMVSVLPAAMIGGSFAYETPTSRFLGAIRNGEVPFDLDFEMNLIDVRDVCNAMVNAIEQGRSGQRYILANSKGISVKDICLFYRHYNPKLKPPIKVGKTILLAVATIAELVGKLLGKEPSLLKSQVRFYYQSKENFDISHSISDLEFSPKPPLTCLRDEHCIINLQGVLHEN
ncbi:NAD-dependent epimerase/dehydratase family protein [Corallincola luteus]|uniref:NAD-dependent epimerase/dehydratase family protein n=1 Tax=Corallincola luteus TaxID=1775177 RepID=A0ABY2AMC3_9GAMM|nr:NAD-dependent epimerase/dehydratase family protein [Corallincola luteus]TCI03745.1 NAD-dependent epimerase/dehydratase family protein [Corallincola luteus]